MKKRINKAKIIGIIILSVTAMFVTACMKRPETEEEYKESFFQDKAIFEEVCEIAYQYEWSAENLEKGIVVLYRQQLEELGVRSDFLKKYQIEKVTVTLDIHDDDIRYVRFCMSDAISEYTYSTVYYSPSREPNSVELGEYMEDLGMYYYKTEVTQLYECYTERLDEHWFLVKYHYFRY